MNMLSLLGLLVTLAGLSLRAVEGAGRDNAFIGYHESEARRGKDVAVDMFSGWQVEKVTLALNELRRGDAGCPAEAGAISGQDFLKLWGGKLNRLRAFSVTRRFVSVCARARGTLLYSYAREFSWTGAWEVAPGDGLPPHTPPCTANL